MDQESSLLITRIVEFQLKTKSASIIQLNMIKNYPDFCVYKYLKARIHFFQSQAHDNNHIFEKAQVNTLNRLE